ncbi:carbohydrate ABC transporter permease [Cohnella rhizosphaerae]|uniref:Maltose/maltodextrin transport system permease protein n=1 Tax=Cohnella rhizosphaerae TaxID=1457232 RepID=A0A9X4KYE4_9BACL|nr:sugar ABC transporter permease [Cohnella rhizosphaerae]MDG0810142.1 sugar ABC transporter permease [Cohnella rhizosphaerae]
MSRGDRAIAYRAGPAGPATAGLLSAFCAGGGQLLNRQYAKGALFMAAYAVALIVGAPRIGRALEGLITLGDTPTRIVDGALVRGDHSIFLLINGLLALFAGAALLLLHALNVTDAYRHRAALIAGGGPFPGTRRYGDAAAAQALPKLGRPAPVHRRSRDGRTALLLLAPALLFVLFVSVVPMLFNVLIAFTNYASPNHIPDRSLVSWTGLQTFSRLLSDRAWTSTFGGIFAWNVVWAVLSTLVAYFGGLAVALLIEHRKVRFKKLWRTAFVLPWAFPSFIAILVFRVLFNGALGPVNGLLERAGLPAVPWLSDPTVAKLTVLLVHFWMSMPFLMALLAGILTTIPRDLYEAAEVDGAGGASKFRRITMPHVLIATSPILIMQFASNFNNFNLIYLLTDGGPPNPDYYFAGSTDILLSWIYKMTLEQNQFNMASAVSIVMFVVVALVSVLNYSRTHSFREKD